MPTFQVTTPSGEFEIEAPDEEALEKVLEELGDTIAKLEAAEEAGKPFKLPSTIRKIPTKAPSSYFPKGEEAPEPEITGKEIIAAVKQIGASVSKSKDNPDAMADVIAQLKDMNAMLKALTKPKPKASYEITEIERGVDENGDYVIVGARIEPVRAN